MLLISRDSERQEYKINANPIALAPKFLPAFHGAYLGEQATWPLKFSKTTTERIHLCQYQNLQGAVWKLCSALFCTSYLLHK